MPRLLLLLILVAGVTLNPARAETPEFTLRIRDHLFYPSELTIPANLKVRLLIINEDPTPEEFESYELNREKVILGGRRTVIFVGPLKPGEYSFFGEFNMSTAQGKLIAE
ncbi:MAG: cupredoxin domain-containing protein [Porticoccaceae bacterium]